MSDWTGFGYATNRYKRVDNEGWSRRRWLSTRDANCHLPLVLCAAGQLTLRASPCAAVSASPLRPRAPFVILLVDDEALLRMCVCEALIDAGFAVVEAAHAHEALDILEQDHETIRVVFTDVQMPGTVDGIDLAYHTHHHWPWISLIITSAQPRLALIALPADSHFLWKPYHLEHAVQHVRQVAEC